MNSLLGRNPGNIYIPKHKIVPNRIICNSLKQKTTQSPFSKQQNKQQNFSLFKQTKKRVTSKKETLVISWFTDASVHEQYSSQMTTFSEIFFCPQIVLRVRCYCDHLPHMSTNTHPSPWETWNTLNSWMEVPLYFYMKIHKWLSYR